MFDTHSDYALNKADKNAIVCPSVTGEHIRLTREDFSSEDEFLYWKDWSDNDLHKIENDGQYDSRCLTLDTQRDTPVPSAEDVLLEHISKAEKEHERATLISQIKQVLTNVQYRRLCLRYIRGLSVEKIADMEGVSPQAIYACLSKAEKTIVNNL